MRPFIVFLLSVMISCIDVQAQVSMPYAPMSSMVRRLCREVQCQRAKQCDRSVDAKKDAQQKTIGGSICALVKIDNGGEQSIVQQGGRILAEIGDIVIADIPISSLPELTCQHGIRRIEAEQGHHLLLDTMAVVTNASPIYSSQQLPQAFRGAGVVMGLMDVGFDLTHPNFYDADRTTTRIRSFWDQIATQDEGDTLYVGQEFTHPNDILAYEHSRDATLIEHGTHTLGIATGNGVGSNYVGMAPESDICLVSNAVTEDLSLIPEEEQYKYTYATDALGFKYIFDYADRVGKPCVISFSEGSFMDFRGDDVLFGEVLSSLVGEGHIIVASAGNAGWNYAYLPKPKGTAEVGAVLNTSDKEWPMTMTTRGHVTLRLAMHGDNLTQIDVTDEQVTQAEDSTLTVQFSTAVADYSLTMTAFPSCYDAESLAFDIMLKSTQSLGRLEMTTIQLIGTDADTELFSQGEGFTLSANDPQYACAQTGYTIHSPSCFADVISVGATSWRQGWTNEAGVWTTRDYRTDGHLAIYSSIGPTYDHRVKPDILAPGSNIISSGSSFFMSGDSYDPSTTVARLQYDGREYPWVVMTGTSMSTPAVGGIIALWLQACPKLTPADIKQIFSDTATRIGTATAQSDNQCGYGAIDAYAGLLEALKLNNISEIPSFMPQGASIMPAEGNKARITFNQIPNSDVRVTIYAVSGQLLTTAIISKGTTTAMIEIPNKVSTVYAVSLSSDDLQCCGSSLIRF